MSYQAYNAILKQSTAELSAAEAQGIAAGLLCIKPQSHAKQWLMELTPKQTLLSDSDAEQLIELFNLTQSSLNADDFEFQLCLPDEDTPLSERVLALKDWCQGFLFALGASGSPISWSRDAREILRDLSEFTKLDAQAEGEEDERDFVEVTEYCRAVVLVLRAELAN